MSSKVETVKSVTLVGAIGNTILAGGKIFVGKLSGSGALVADGLHSLSDLVSDAAIYFGASLWSQPADDDHPYGHGRYETIINAFLAISLFSVSLGLIYSALSPSEISAKSNLSLIALIAASLSVLIKEGLYRWTLKVGLKIDSLALIANAHHHRSDALSSLPVIIAVGCQWYYPEAVYVDSIATVLVALMIIKAAVEIATPVFFELTEKTTTQDLVRKIQLLSLEKYEIKEVHEIKTRHLGGDVMIDLHILVDEWISVHDGHLIAEGFSKEVKERIPCVKHVMIHVEPYVCSERLIYRCKHCA